MRYLPSATTPPRGRSELGSNVVRSASGGPRWRRLAEINLMTDVRGDLHAAGTDQFFNGGVVRHPPVRRIAGEPVFDERHAGPAGIIEGFAFIDRVVPRVGIHLHARRGQRLK